jgi:hypothetical protein
MFLALEFGFRIFFIHRDGDYATGFQLTRFPGIYLQMEGLGLEFSF